MQVELLKKNGTYTDPTSGEERQSTRFYIRCGDALIPIEPVYFKNADTGKDSQYGARKQIMSAFASVLPDKPDRGNKSKKAARADSSTAAMPQPVDNSDGSIDF